MATTTQVDPMALLAGMAQQTEKKKGGRDANVVAFVNREVILAYAASLRVWLKRRAAKSFPWQSDGWQSG